MPTTLEKEIEAKLTAMVHRHGGECLKWVCPGWAGVPDRIVLMPEGRVWFVELKRPKGGRRSAMQLWWERKLTGMGFNHRFIKNEAEIEALETEIKRI